MSKTNEHILIVSDLEGIIGFQGFCSQEDLRRLMTKQLHFGFQVIRRILGQKSKITICDVHNDGLLLDAMEFSHKGLQLLQGITSLSSCSWDYDIAILFGFHGMRNRLGKFSHTFRDDIIRMWRENSNADIGEVSSFICWIESKGVPVVLVSGEGDFASETVSSKRLMHQVNCEESEEALYADLEKKLVECLANRATSIKPSEDTQTVYVEVDNKEKLSILAHEGFCVRNEAFAFSSFDAFFKNGYSFADALNRATMQIIRKNLCLAKEIKRQNIEEKMPCHLFPVLSKPINLIDHNDREFIRESLLL